MRSCMHACVWIYACAGGGCRCQTDLVSSLSVYFVLLCCDSSFWSPFGRCRHRQERLNDPTNPYTVDQFTYIDQSSRFAGSLSARLAEHQPGTSAFQRGPNETGQATTRRSGLTRQGDARRMMRMLHQGHSRSASFPHGPAGSFGELRGAWSLWRSLKQCVRGSLEAEL